jgi:hypothetical protein
MPTAPDHLHAAPHDTNRVLSLLFGFAIALPLVATLLFVAGPSPSGDNPDSAQWPPAPRSLKDVERWPTRFRRWFKDHYAFRRELIQAHGALLLGGLGVSPSPTVLIGREGWWYYTDDGAMADMVSAEPMSAGDLEAWRVVLQHNRDWLAGQDIPYLFVLAPDKHLVYPEYLPATMRVLGPPRVSQLTTYLGTHSTVDVIDLLPPLLEQKRVERVFHRTDTHWNDRGALVAYLEIARWMARVRPRAGSVTGAEFERTSTTGEGRDLPRMLGVQGLVTEENLDVAPRSPRQARIVEPATGGIDLHQARIVTEHPDRSLPRIVIFRDSFMTPLIPLLAESCSRCVFLWQNDIDPGVVRDERPDLVIHEIVGRKLQGYLPYDAVADIGTR